MNFFCRLPKQLIKRFVDESGLTLIEIMASMMVFLVVSAGVAATFTSGLRTMAHTRLATMAKAQAQEQIEEMRSRVFFVPYSTDPDVGTTTEIDLLDRYYPNLNQGVVTDSQGWQGWYTNSGAGAYYTKKSPEDNGIVRTVETRFINNEGDVLTPYTGYDSNYPGYDTPPSKLVEVTVTTAWADLTGDNSFQLVSRVSATSQSVDCNSDSNSRVDVTGGILGIFTGASEPFDSFIDGNFGEGHVILETTCGTETTVNATGGRIQLAGVAEEIMGADVFVTPPVGHQETGPVSVGPTAEWPVTTIISSVAEGNIVIVDEVGGLIEAQGAASVVDMSEQIQQVDGWTGGTVDGYRQWDFLNPVVQAVGGSQLPLLQQLDGVSIGEGTVLYQQVNILPLGAKTSDTPSALQGLVFVRDFQADAVSYANGIPGGASNQVTYSAIIGIFDPTSPADCAGDACYDLYLAVGPTNPMQTAVNLASSKYRLQNALFTEFHSYTSDEINNAKSVSSDGTNANVSIDALLKISAQFGTEVRWKTANPHQDEITLVSPQGLEQVWLGAFDLSIHQKN